MAWAAYECYLVRRMETSADRLFANAAMEAGYLEEKQVAELLEEAEKAGTPLSKLCREKKTITPKQVRLSLEAAFEALKKEDEVLASLVVENDLASACSPAEREYCTSLSVPVTVSA